MKFIKILFIVNLFILSLLSSSYANEKSAFIDIDYVIKNSNVGKRVLDKISKQNEKNIKKLKKKNDSLKDLESQIKSKKNLISEKEFNNEVLSFQNKVKTFTDEKNLLVKEFNDLKKKEINNIFKLFEPIIESYMKENSIHILLDTKNIFMGKKESNLSDDILKKINIEIK